MSTWYGETRPAKAHRRSHDGITAEIPFPTNTPISEISSKTNYPKSNRPESVQGGMGLGLGRRSKQHRLNRIVSAIPLEGHAPAWPASFRIEVVTRFLRNGCHRGHALRRRRGSTALQEAEVRSCSQFGFSDDQLLNRATFALALCFSKIQTSSPLSPRNRASRCRRRDRCLRRRTDFL